MRPPAQDALAILSPIFVTLLLGQVSVPMTEKVRTPQVTVARVGIRGSGSWSHGFLCTDQGSEAVGSKNQPWVIGVIVD